MVANITLSGWGQAASSLCHLIPGSTPIDYGQAESTERALALIAQQAVGADTIIGWSLGGQLAVRLVAEGRIKPKRLVLIGAPFQFVAQSDEDVGMARREYDKFYHQYARDPERALHKMQTLIAFGDHHEEQVSSKSSPNHAHCWLKWLEYLERFTCHGMDMKDFPPTLIIHGRNDHIVDARQSDYFMNAITHSKRLLLDQCGHAPHWHNETLVQNAIADFIHV